MKKNLLLTFLVIGVLFTSCQKKAAEPIEETAGTTAATEAVTTAADQLAAVEEPTTKGEPEAATSTPAAEDGTREIEGVVVDAAMHSIIIETAAGEILNLTLEDYEVISRDGLAIDDKVRITYQQDQVIKIVEIQ